MPFEFRGFRSELEPEWVISHSSRVSRFNDLLVDPRLGGLNANEARTLIERLINGGYEFFGTEYVGEMNAEVEAIIALRSELRSRFEEVLNLPPGRPTRLPANLEPAALGPLLEQLEIHLERISGRDPIRAAGEAQPMTTDEFLKRFEHDEAQSHPGEQAPTEHPAETEGHVPPDPLGRVRDPRVLEFVNQQAARLQQLLRRNGAAWIVEVQPSRRAGALGQARGLMGADPTFAGNGFEVVIRPPWAGTEGLRLEADGIRFVGSDGFEVLEWKGLDNEPLFTKIDSPEALQAAAEARTRGQTSPPGLTYIDEPGRLAGEPQNYEKLRADMNRDSQYFQELRGLGCRGMVWMTNSPGMARAFEQVMAELHLEGIVPMGPQ